MFYSSRVEVTIRIYYSGFYSSRDDVTFGEMSCLTDSLFNLISSDDVRVISNLSLDQSDFPDLIHFSDTEEEEDADADSDNTVCSQSITGADTAQQVLQKGGICVGNVCRL